MKKYFSLCIWDCGPGRPSDNEYVLENKLYHGNTIILSFVDGEKCIIENPTNIIDTDNRLTIERATKIIWYQNYYGKCESENTTITIQYELKENGHVCITADRPSNITQTISSNKRIAFDSHIRIQQ